MILSVYILKGDGDTLYNATYDNGRRIEDNPTPPFVKACVSLLHARDSTKIGTPYLLQQSGFLWAYAFFDSFAIVVSATQDEDAESLGRIMLALGRSLARTFGDVISSWSGNMGEIYEMNDIVAQFVLADYGGRLEQGINKLESIINRALERHEVAYIGILDENGEMISGNVPESHLDEISNHLPHYTIQASSDLVPISMKVKGYTVQLSRIGFYSVVAAGYQDSSQIPAVHAVDDVIESISSYFTNKVED